MQREAGHEPMLAGFQAGEANPGDAHEAGLLRDDLNVAERVQPRDRGEEHGGEQQRMRPDATRA